MTQKLRLLAIVPEDPGSIPSTKYNINNNKRNTVSTPAPFFKWEKSVKYPVHGYTSHGRKGGFQPQKELLSLSLALEAEADGEADNAGTELECRPGPRCTL